MKQITAEEFYLRTEINANWCAEITEPIEVPEFLNYPGKEITALSPLITFSGRDENGDVAVFRDCENLKVAEGTFHGYVSFSKSGIEEIGDLVIVKTDKNGNACSFMGCERLKIAQGTYPGLVTFSESGIQQTKNLKVLNHNSEGVAIYLEKCWGLDRIRGQFNGKVVADDFLLEEYKQYLQQKKASKFKDKETTLEI